MERPDLDAIETDSTYRLRHPSSDHEVLVFQPHRTILELIAYARQLERDNNQWFTVAREKDARITELESALEPFATAFNELPPSDGYRVIREDMWRAAEVLRKGAQS